MGKKKKKVYDPETPHQRERIQLPFPQDLIWAKLLLEFKLKQLEGKSIQQKAIELLLQWLREKATTITKEEMETAFNFSLTQEQYESILRINLGVQA